MRSLYEALGAHVVDGGTTLNPSTYELLAGIHSAAAEEVLVLPNSRNVILAAEHAAEMSQKPARVVECTSPQAGIAALVEFDPDAPADRNAERVAEALSEVRVGAVAPAARDDKQGRFARGDAVGFVGDEIVAWGGAGSTLHATIAFVAEGMELVTVIEGEEAPIPLDEVIVEAPRDFELDLHRGDQPHYWWLLAAQ
jgi:dihydroxyacetone kinase-like predicted kinase